MRMSCLRLPISLVTTPEWVERLERAVRAIQDSAHAVRAAVVREKAAVKFFLAARRLNEHINELLVLMDESTRELQSGQLEFSAPDNDTSAAFVIASLEICYRITHGLHAISTFAGLKKRKLTKPQVENFAESAERLLDYLVWLKEAVSEGERYKAEAGFSEAMRELELGETVALL